MPEITTSRLVRGKRRPCAKRSEIKVADEALSSNALATADAPSGDLTRTRHVINKELCFMPTAVADRIPFKELLLLLVFGLTFGGSTRVPS